MCDILRPKHNWDTLKRIDIYRTPVKWPTLHRATLDLTKQEGVRIQRAPRKKSRKVAAGPPADGPAPIGGLGGDDGSDDDDDMSFAEFLEMLIEEDRGHADDDAVAVDADRAD
eukprot:624932-Pyramimonas_sp.AAC.1